MVRENVLQDLTAVERPARYAGGEWNSVAKRGPVAARLLLAYPDAYEIGMSHLGLRILYSLVNDCDDLAAERAFCPWPDREARLRAAGEPLRSLESGRPAAEFDLIGFSLQHELNFTNLLAMLDLAGLPLRSAQRDADAPLVIAGGPVAFNPEPLAPFIDLFVIGDAEELLPRLMRDYAGLRRSGAAKAEILRRLSRLPGVYAPALYGVEADPETGLLVVTPPGGTRPFIGKAVVADLDGYPFPADTVVPFCEIVHDRAAIELARGCSRGCRFCQAGVVYMPERQRDPQAVADTVLRMLAATGYGDVSLSSLTPNDYRGLGELVTALMSRFSAEGTSLSLASLSPSGLEAGLLEAIKGVRKTGLTIAPEAGTQRLRDAINKGISEAEILASARAAFGLGWRLIKLYFMIGLPTETRDDVEGIAKLALAVAGLEKGVKVNASVASFVPKPHTPFQWLAMARADELLEKQRLLRGRLRRTRVRVRTHDVETSLLEGVLSRGDRRVGDAVEQACRLGCRFDGWGDRLRIDLWKRAFDEAGVDPDAYLHRELPTGAALPWSHIGTGVGIAFLEDELRLALQGKPATRCAPRRCPECGACPPEMLRERWAQAPREKIEVRVPERGVHDSPTQRVRFRYRKRGIIRLLSHLDLSRLVARTFRRAGIAVALSRGFHPQPRISFGPALPLGIEGHSEFLDALLHEPPEADELLRRLNAASPGGKGLEFTAAAPVGDKEPSLGAALVAAGYLVRRADGSAFDREAVDRFLASDSVEWTRTSKGKERLLDLRAAVLAMEPDGSGRELRLLLSLEGGSQARPAEVAAAAFSLDPGQIEVVREQLFLRRGGRLRPPI